MSFTISQSSRDLALMEAIQNFLNQLSEKSPKDIAANLHINKTLPNFPFDLITVTINQALYISNVIIPWLDSLTFLSKKELDYED